jgi:DNA-binding transcriptional MerR regulator
MRMYGPEHVVAARGILRLKCAGFTLERIEVIREHLRGSETALGGMANLSRSIADQEERLRASIAELQLMLDELAAARRCMELCDGCHGKAFDAGCIECLGEASHHAMPDCLSSVLQAACAPAGKVEP